MTWVYRNTGSVFVAVLMHASYAGGQVLLEPINASQIEICSGGVCSASAWQSSHA